ASACRLMGACAADGALSGSAGASPSLALCMPPHQPPGASPRFDGSDAGAVLTKPDASACRLMGLGACAADGALCGSAGASPSRVAGSPSHQPPGASPRFDGSDAGAVLTEPD